LVELYFAFEILAVLLIRGQRSFVGGKLAQVRLECFLDYGDVPGKLSDFLFEGGDSEV
jgi:hypothetical protein